MKTKRLAIGRCISVIIALLTLGIWTSYFICKTIVYEVNHSTKTEAQTDSSKEIPIAVLSDLHDHQFGKDNQKLVDKVRKESPKAIFILGDMLNGDSEDSSVPVGLVEKLSKIAPVFYALGNHELDYMSAHGDGLVEELEDAGAEVLDLESKKINIGGKDILVGGMYDYAFALDDNNSTKKENMPAEVYEFLSEFTASDDYKIMLAHRPDSFIFGEAQKTWDIDLVLSGHNHGGQVILPLAGGLYGSDQGWFPEYDYGMFSFEKFDMLITRGLGSNPKALPRFNNIPEIMVVNLKF